MRKPEDYKYHTKRDLPQLTLASDGLTSEVLIRCRMCNDKIIAYRLSESHAHIEVECDRCHQMYEGIDLHIKKDYE